MPTEILIIRLLIFDVASKKGHLGEKYARLFVTLFFLDFTTKSLCAVWALQRTFVSVLSEIQNIRK